MAGFANMDTKEVVLTHCRMTWLDLGELVASLAHLMCRGAIPVGQQAEYQEHAAALFAAQKAITFVGDKYPDIVAYQRKQAEANKPKPKQPKQEVADDAANDQALDVA
jgi:Zn-finger nucleic acid-binding protein